MKSFGAVVFVWRTFDFGRLGTMLELLVTCFQRPTFLWVSSVDSLQIICHSTIHLEEFNMWNNLFIYFLFIDINVDSDSNSNIITFHFACSNIYRELNQHCIGLNVRSLRPCAVWQLYLQRHSVNTLWI